MESSWRHRQVAIETEAWGLRGADRGNFLGSNILAVFERGDKGSPTPAEATADAEGSKSGTVGPFRGLQACVQQGSARQWSSQDGSALGDLSEMHHLRRPSSHPMETG